MKTLKVISIIFLILITGCSKEDSTDDLIDTQSNISLSSDKIELQNAEMAFGNVENLTLTESTYSATLGDNTVTLFVIDASTFTYIVPFDIETGQYELIPEFGGNNLTLNITSNALPSSPNEVISNFIGNYEEDIDSTISQFDENTIPLDIITAKTKIKKAISDFEKLSDADKIIAAQFIYNNSEGFDELEENLDEMLSDDLTSNKSARLAYKCDGLCLFSQGLKILGSAALIKLSAPVGLIAGVVIGIDVGLSYLTGKRSYLISKLKLALGKAFNIAYFAQNHLAEVTFDKTDEFVNNLYNFKNKSAEQINFQNQTPISIKVKPYYRTLNIEDKDHSDSNVSTFVSLYSKFKNTWDNNLSSSFGEIPTFNDNEEQKFAEDLSQFTIEITENSENVSVSDITGTVEDFKVTFTNNTDIEQNFTFDIIFNNNGIIAKKSIQAILDIENNNPFIGNWKAVSHSKGVSINKYNKHYTSAHPNCLVDGYNTTFGNATITDDEIVVSSLLLYKLFSGHPDDCSSLELYDTAVLNINSTHTFNYNKNINEYYFGGYEPNEVSIIFINENTFTYNYTWWGNQVITFIKE